MSRNILKASRIELIHNKAICGSDQSWHLVEKYPSGVEKITDITKSQFDLFLTACDDLFSDGLCIDRQFYSGISATFYGYNLDNQF